MMTLPSRGLSVLTLVFCVGMSACGRPGNSTGTSAPTADANAAARKSTTENQINALSRDKIKDGGTFTIALQSWPANFNYYEVDGTEQDHHYVWAALMPTAFVADAGGTPHWNPDLLVSEPVLQTDPRQVVTYDINPKAKWSDGTPITWQDFYWQWKSTNGKDKAYQIASSSGYEDIENVEKGKDDRKVIVTFARRFADWQALFYPIYPAVLNKDPKMFNEGWKDKPLITAGPFRLESADRTAKNITIVRDDNWWGDRAKLDKIVFRAIDPDAQIDALANGEVDYVDMGPDANTYRRAQAAAGIEIRVAGGPNYRHFTINGTSPNLSDVRVRRAIGMAINRESIAKALLGPLDIPPVALNNHLFMENQTGYQDNSGDVGKYDPAKAGQLLDDAGWKLDGAVRKKNGKPLEINCVIPSGISASRQETALVQNMLGQIGVTMKINAVPISDFFDKYIRPGQFDVTVFAWLGTPFPISSSKSLYAMPTKNAKGELEVQQNYARIGMPEIDKLFADANGELDRQKAIALANQADAMIWQEGHSLTLYQRPELAACRKGLANFGAFGFADYIYKDTGWAK